MSLRSFSRFALIGALMIVLFGCAAKAPAPRFVWPPPPEQPRMEWKGVFYSEASLKRAAGKDNLSKFLGSTDDIIMITPYGIVSDSAGKVFVSDIHRKNIWVFDFNENKVDLFSKNSAMQTPTGMAMDKAGNLYVADSGKGVVWVFNSEGKALSMIGEKEMTKPSYLTIDDTNNRLYVSDGKDNFVAIFDLQGNFLSRFGELGREPGQFHAPQGLTIGPDGNLYVADMYNARVQYFDTEGKYLGSFGERGDQTGQFENPKDLVFDSEGNLHVIDGRRSNLMTFTPDGKLLLVTGTGQASVSEFGFGAPRSVFVDANDRIYVSEALGKRFSVWQYMSSAYLKRNPYTENDKQILMDYMQKQQLKNDKK